MEADLGHVPSASVPVKELPSFHQNQPLENPHLTLNCTSPPIACVEQYL